MFPSAETSHPDGLVAMGGELTPEVLEEAYSQGIFPWPQKDCPLLWFSPPQRGILKFTEFKVPESTQRRLRNKTFEMTINEDFEAVIKQCSRVPRKHDSDTWIIPEMVDAYVKLHHLGKALSVEAWFEGQLVGGLYGVLINDVFSGESMFYKKSEASKVCLVHMVKHLEAQGHRWMDIQMVTPLLEKFGGRYIPRKEFLNMIKK